MQTASWGEPDDFEVLMAVQTTIDLTSCMNSSYCSWILPVSVQAYSKFGWYWAWIHVVVPRIQFWQMFIRCASFTNVHSINGYFVLYCINALQ